MRIIDGDTVVIVDDTVQYKVRLAQIDTPERGQPWSNKSRQALSSLIFGKVIEVRDIDIDRYGRTVGDVWFGNSWINAALVKSGNAWVFEKYLRDPVLLEYQREAVEQRLGLWQLPEAERLPPWLWRRNEK